MRKILQPHHLMKRLTPQYLWLLIGLLWPALSQAQVNAYQFTSTSGVYTPITGTIITPLVVTGTAQYNGLALPFTFRYNGANYDTVSCNVNGIVFFRNTATNSTTSTAIAAAGINLVYPFAGSAMASLAANNSDLQTTTLGTAPNRQFVIQYRNFNRTVAGDVATRINVQVVLEETTNNVIFRYGTAVGSTNAFRTAQVGVRGTTTTDIVRLGGTWDIPTATTTTPLPTLGFTTTNFPVDGSIFTFTPPIQRANDMAMLSYINAPAATVCDSTIVRGLRFIAINRGTDAASNIDYRVQVTDSIGTTVHSEALNSTRTLAQSALDTLLISDFQLLGIKPYSIRVTVATPDEEVRNDTLRSAAINTNNCSPLNYVFSQNTTTYTPLVGGTIISVANEDNNVTASRVIAMPFSLTVDGTLSSSLFISNNGYVTLGTTRVNSLTNPLTANNNTIAPFAANLHTGAAGVISYLAEGTAPNRTFTVEWANMNLANLGAADVSLTTSFQLIIHENQQIEFVYGPYLYTGTSTTLTAQVGIRGSSTTRFQTRRIVYPTELDLANNVQAWNLNETFAIRANTTISSGLVLQFTPPLPAANDISVSGITGTAATLCTGTSTSISATITNLGTADYANAQLSLTVTSSTGTVVSTQTASGSASLAIGATEVVSFPSFVLPATDTYTYLVIVTSPDEVASNNTTTSAVLSTIRTCNLSPYTLAVSRGTFTPLVGGTAIAFPNNDDGNANVPLATPFSFNGTPYSSVNLSTNGYITFGTDPNNFASRTVVMSLGVNAVVAYNRDIFALSTSYYGVDVATNDFIIEYRGRTLGGTAQEFHFQYRLRSDNSIAVVYDSVTVATGTPGVGLSTTNSGISALTGSNWLNPSIVDLGTSTMTINATSGITTGLTYTWTPPVSQAVDVALAGIVNVPSGSGCNGTISRVAVVVSNNGTASYSNAQVLLTASDATGVVTSQTLTSSLTLAPAQRDTLFANDITLPNGTYTLTATLSSADSVARNNSSTSGSFTLRTCNLAPYTFASSIGTFSRLTGGTAITNFQTNAGLADNDNGTANVTLPAPFLFDGTPYSSVNVSTNGYITFSTDPNSFASRTGIMSSALNTVAAYNRNILASNVVYGVDGATGDFVIEYSGFIVNAPTSQLHFQYRLRTDNSILVVYDSLVIQTAATPGVGLRTVSNGISTLTGGNWINPRLSDLGTSTNALALTTVIPSGLTYTWTPPAPLAVDLAVESIVNVPVGTICNDPISRVGVLIANRGTQNFDNARVLLTARNATGVVTSQILTSSLSLVSGQTDTLFASDIALPLGTYTFNAALISADSLTRNNTAPASGSFTLITCQFAPYTFAISQSTYSPLVGGTAITFTGGGLNPNDDGTANVLLPVPFTFNGTPYSSVNVSTNGYITFNTDPNDFASRAGMLNVASDVIAAFNNDLEANTVTYGVDATNGDFVIDYSGIQFSTTTSRLHFQYRLRNDNSIVVMYDSVTLATTEIVGVGLRTISSGITAFTGTDLATPTSISLGTSTMSFAATYTVTSGLTHTWTPTIANSSDIAIVSIANVTTGSTCSVVPVAPSIIIRNAGSAVYNGAQVNFRATDAGGAEILNTTVSNNPSLAVGQSDTLVVPSFLLSAAGTYNLTASLVSTDSVVTNNIITSTATVRVCNLAPYTFAASQGTFNRLTGGTAITFTGGNDNGTANIALPTAFRFNDTTYSSVNVSTNGYITFNTDPNNAASRTRIMTSALNTIAAFNRNLVSTNTVYGIDASTGDFVIEYSGIQLGTTLSRLHFQYRLRPDYSIVVVYDSLVVESNANAGAGLRTRVSTRGISNLTGANWINPTLSDTPTDFNQLLAGTPIPSGLTYTWTPPVTAAIDATVTAIAGVTNNVCNGATVTPRVVVRSLGSSSIQGGIIDLTITPPSGAPTILSVPFTNTIASNSQDTINMSAFTYTGAGNYVFSATVTVTGDEVSTNNTIARTITVNAVPTIAPTISASGTISFCPGGSVVLTSSVATGNLWSNGATTRSITVSNAGDYTVQTIGTGNCAGPVSAATTVTITTAPTRPTITSSGPTTFCGGTGSNVTLTSTPADSYLWSNGANTQSITVSAQGTYWVNVGTTGVTCRSFNDSVRIIVSTPPTTPSITATGSTTICSGNSVVLQVPAVTGSSYLWSNGAITRTITVSDSGRYSAQVINAAGCTSAVSNVIRVSTVLTPARVNIIATGATSFCSPDTVTLSAPTGFPIYNWFRGAVAVGSTESIRVSASGIYYVKVGFGGTCLSANSDSIRVVATAPPSTPTITATGSTTICSGNTVLLSAPAVTGASYLWSNGAITRTITVSDSGRYSAQVINVAGCTSAVSNVIRVSTVLTPARVLITANGATNICTSDTVTLTAPAGFPIYSWFKGTAPAGNTQSIRVSATGNYYVKVAFGGTCFSANSDTISINAATAPAAPIVTISGVTTLCAGRDSAILTASATASYLWSTGETTRSITVRTAGVYTVRAVSGACNSVSSIPVNIIVNSSPATPTFSLTGNVLTATAAGATRFSWTYNTRAIGNGTDTVRLRGDGVYQMKAFIGACFTTASYIVSKVAMKQSSELQVFPIPTSSELKVSLANIAGNKVMLQLMDASGRTVLSEEVATDGSLNTSLNISHLPAGVYQLVVLGEQVAISRAVIKQ